MSQEFIEYEKKYKICKNKFYELIKKRLKNSIYPTQVNDFFFLTIPKGHPNEDREIPVDYLLKNIVLFFWENKFITLGWNEGLECRVDEICVPAFISFESKLVNGKNALSRLKNILRDRFGKDNIFILDETKRPKKYEKKSLIEYTKILLKGERDFFNKNPKKVLINISEKHIAFCFRIMSLNWVNEKLGIDMPPIEDRYPGNLLSV
ncbi:MAG: hypothetical protein Terrestrivirus8_54 [Terrestrivirus sp.]|uniref:Uncharacterized protein n=1 Tax=Terrestrivirus sp. TaxID=2487775 RepID=A0A3G4ZRE5_9VIRU|nr:MAG: hypothetical protein Terrestrivirus8_54 [Terrestrivirus sp.]